MVVYLIGVACEVLVDQVEWVPPEKDVFVVDFSFSVGSEGLVHKSADVELYSRFKAFFLHPLAAVTTSCKAMFTADLLQVLNDLRAN